MPQSICLSDHTIRHNVAFGLQREEIDDDAVWRALTAAQLEDFVRDLPGCLETPVGEHGIRLSGGQRQRIGMARALYGDPPVLVLDEATAALDNATESEVMRAVHALHGQKTVLIIAHRVTTLEACDLVVGMESRRIVQIGPPSEVLRRHH
ncbi:MAG: ABC transporter ATP-binding protein [Accumulibacter sp.]